MPKVRKSIRVPESHINILDKLIEVKKIPCRSEGVRVALDRLIAKDLKILQKYKEKIIEVNTEINNRNEIKQKKIDDFF